MAWLLFQNVLYLYKFIIFDKPKNCNMLYLSDRVTLDENLCNGRPTIRGLRVTVQTVLEFLSMGDTKEDILKQYPDLEPEDIDACLKFATQLLSHKYIFKIIAA